jgi:hypothetical protein
MFETGGALASSVYLKVGFASATMTIKTEKYVQQLNDFKHPFTK